MRYFTILIFTTLWVLNSYAQEFSTQRVVKMRIVKYLIDDYLSIL